MSAGHTPQTHKQVRPRMGVLQQEGQQTFIINKGQMVYLWNVYFRKLFFSFLLFFFFFFFFSFSATPLAYGSSQARGRIGAAAADLRHSHGNTGSEPHLHPTAHFTATLDP